MLRERIPQKKSVQDIYKLLKQKAKQSQEFRIAYIR